MLNQLQIRNIAVIEQSEIRFDRGLNVLTGETGAGKSIVIDAISAILGARTYRDLIRTGCEQASVSAVFSDIAELPWFQKNGVAYETELRITREIYTDGKNVCRVNGQSVTVAALRELGKSLIRIHGQNDTQALFDEQTHLTYIDALAPAPDALLAFHDAFEAYRLLSERVRKLSNDEGERLRRLEMLRHEIEEIENAKICPGEEDRLRSRKRVLLNAEKISSALSAAVAALYGDDNGGGALDLISAAEKELSRLSSVDDGFAERAEEVSSLRKTLQETVRDLRAQLDETAFSENELDEIESRLGILTGLQRKYGATEEQILAYAKQAREEAELLDLSDDRLQELKNELTLRRSEAEAAALRLRDERKNTAERFCTQMENELSQLGMPHFQFAVDFEETELAENGVDFVRFLMSANVGESLRPLSRIASGGELARVMLALENVLSAKAQVSTMIFDEVDAGVSGRAAQKVAEKLHEVSGGKQVLCVTHLAQIAAMADSHLLIEKNVRSQRTFTEVRSLDRSERISELARIIGGISITDTTRMNAEEMLTSAETAARQAPGQHREEALGNAARSS